MEKEEGVNSVYHIWILNKREKILYCLREKQKENKKSKNVRLIYLVWILNK